MTELPTSPFPELHALDEKRSVPSLGELLGGPGLPPPASSPSLEASPSTRPPASRFPNPAPVATPLPPAAPSIPLVAGPRNEGETLRETLAALMAGEADRETAAPPSGAGAPTTGPNSPPPPSGTDAELAEALRPLLAPSPSQAPSLAGPDVPNQLEPMLRNTVRRAIAEQMEHSRLFRDIGTVDRLLWRLQALFTSRSYDDIVFDRTRRFQVEEAFLLRKDSQTLISYASHDPSRHASPRRVQSTVRLLAKRLRAPDGSTEASFDLPDHRTGLVREGEHCLLVAVLRGRSNALVRADLDYVLHQAQARFGSRLALRSDAFLQVLQPILEGCLLIQSPAPPH